jgi:mRNA-degrading endonuclease HigB of HigAB toxin-antitoxin module
MENLPADLGYLLKQIDQEAEEYPNRRSDLKSLDNWLQNGNFDMARHTAKNIIQRQQQLRSVREGGLPTGLQNLLKRVEAETEEYPNRHSDLKSLNGWLQNGNFDMARHAAEDIIQRQQQLRSVREVGLPADLQNLLKRVETEAEEYPNHRSDLKSLNGWLQNGNFDMARHTAEDIIQRQQQLRSARGGLPADLQNLLKQVEAGAEEYPNRRSDLKSLNSWLENGNFEMARHTAEDIIQRQRQLRSVREGGLPADLQSLLEQVEVETEEYPNRRSELKSLNGWLENGNFDMARHTVEGIIQRQRTLRQAKGLGKPAQNPTHAADG